MVVDKHARDAIRSGALSVFAPAVRRIRGRFRPGDVVKIETAIGDFLGYAFAQTSDRDVRSGRAPGIVARIFDRKGEYPERSPDEIVLERIEKRYRFRKRWKVDAYRDHMRVVFSEADEVPGLILDKFNDIAVFQTTCPAIERIILGNAVELLETLDVDTLYEKNDSRKRRQLGMEVRKRVVAGEKRVETVVEEYGVRFAVNVEEGQKTGFYIDQVENRAEVQELVDEGRVLDVFTYVGGFAIHAAVGGAEEVMGIDKFDRVIQAAYRNADLNDVRDRVKFLVGDAFALLEKFERRGEEFDVVILDPPAFVTSKKHLNRGRRAYFDVNYKALGLVRDGGLFVTCSCSHFLEPSDFVRLVNEAAARRGVRLRMLGPLRGQPPCHPIVPGNPDTRYLKAMFCVVEH
ncbi:class I SAM-dependent rRNA methyltransferase [Methanopyrus sp.]